MKPRREPDAGPSRAPWAVLVGPETAMVVVPRAPRGRRAAARAMGGLPAAAPVALVGTGALNRSRLRRVAQAAGVRIEHEYVVLPSVESGRYVVEDDPDTMAVLWQNLATPPPGATRSTALIAALAAVGRRRLPWWVLGTLTPRVALGYRGAER